MRGLTLCLGFLAGLFLFFSVIRRQDLSLFAIALKLGDRLWKRDVVNHVKFKRLSDDEVSAYLRSGEWEGKAGGYAIQGIGGAFVPWISGSFTGIVGLPLAETAGLLAGAGYPVTLEGTAA